MPFPIKTARLSRWVRSRRSRILNRSLSPLISLTCFASATGSKTQSTPTLGLPSVLPRNWSRQLAKRYSPNVGDLSNQIGSMELCREARKELKLTPDDISNANKAADTVKRLLSNLATIVQGLAELRN